MDRQKLATEIRQQVWETFKALDWPAEVSFLGVNDRVFLVDVEGAECFWVARGGYLEKAISKEPVKELGRDVIGFHLYVPEEEVDDDPDGVRSRIINATVTALKEQVDKRISALRDLLNPPAQAKVTIFGDLSSAEWTDQEKERWHLTGRVDFGAGYATSPPTNPL